MSVQWVRILTSITIAADGRRKGQRKRLPQKPRRPQLRKQTYPEKQDPGQRWKARACSPLHARGPPGVVRDAQRKSAQAHSCSSSEVEARSSAESRSQEARRAAIEPPRPAKNSPAEGPPPRIAATCQIRERHHRQSTLRASCCHVFMATGVQPPPAASATRGTNCGPRQRERGAAEAAAAPCCRPEVTDRSKAAGPYAPQLPTQTSACLRPLPACAPSSGAPPMSSRGGRTPGFSTTGLRPAICARAARMDRSR